MKTELRDIATIFPYEKNPRLNDTAVDAVARSIQEFGFRQPIVVDADGVIVVGHTRWKAAKKLGLETVPVHIATELTAEQIRAYRIADNKIGELSEWNLELLPAELSDLGDSGFDLGSLGFSQEELARLFEPEVQDGLCDPEAVPDAPDVATTQLGDLWILGSHRLLCGDSSNAQDVDRLLDGATVHLVNTDPPYNVRVEPRSKNAIAAGNSSFRADGRKRKADSSQRTKLHPKDRQLTNDFVSEEEFDRLLDAWFGNISRVLSPGRSFYIFGGYANCGNYPPVLKRHGLYFSQAIIWDKLHPVLTRKDYMGAHEWCQPAETTVVTPDGVVPLGSLRDGDRVVSYSRKHNVIVGLRDGLSVRRTSRRYKGPLVGIVAGGRTTWCTPGHLWSVKLVADADQWWCVYVMRRGSWWRVGKSKLLSTWGFGVKHRLKTEDADEAWILSVHQTNVDATIAEQLILAKYGIPTTTWSESAKSRRTLANVCDLYARLDLERLQANALRVLGDHGRCIDHPFLRAWRTRDKMGRRLSSLIRACNILDGVMQVPVPMGGQTTSWQPAEVICDDFVGEVHSLDVERYGHYLADGIVTHNCFYGWKEGAPHRFYGPPNIPDLWHVKKIPPQKLEHLTGKPAELAVMAIQYSSVQGENVLDLFAGSGSTLIGAEQTARRAYLMEIDPLYCDVVADRFQRFTGQPAILARTGESPIPMKPREKSMR